MIKTRYYLKFKKSTSTFGDDPQKWRKVFGWEFETSNGIRIYYDKDTKNLYCYEKPNLLSQKEWGHSMMSLHSPDLLIDYEKKVDVTEEVTKLKSGKSQKTQWKSSNRGGNNGKNVKLNPKPSSATKKPGPVRHYDKVKQDGFTRLNKPKNNPPKGTILEIFTENVNSDD